MDWPAGRAEARSLSTTGCGRQPRGQQEDLASSACPLQSGTPRVHAPGPHEPWPGWQCARRLAAALGACAPSPSRALGGAQGTAPSTKPHCSRQASRAQQHFFQMIQQRVSRQGCSPRLGERDQGHWREPQPTESRGRGGWARGAGVRPAPCTAAAARSSGSPADGREGCGESRSPWRPHPADQLTCAQDSRAAGLVISVPGTQGHAATLQPSKRLCLRLPWGAPSPLPHAPSCTPHAPSPLPPVSSEPGTGQLGLAQPAEASW